MNFNLLLLLSFVLIEVVGCGKGKAKGAKGVINSPKKNSKGYFSIPQLLLDRYLAFAPNSVNLSVHRKCQEELVESLHNFKADFDRELYFLESNGQCLILLNQLGIKPFSVYKPKVRKNKLTIWHRSDTWQFSMKNFLPDREFIEEKGNNVFLRARDGNILVYQDRKTKRRVLMQHFNRISAIDEFRFLVNLQRIPGMAEFIGYSYYNNSYYFIYEFDGVPINEFINWKEVGDRQDVLLGMVKRVHEIYVEVEQRKLQFGMIRPELVFVTSDGSLKILPFTDRGEEEMKMKYNNSRCFASFLHTICTASSQNWALRRFWYFIENASLKKIELNDFSVDATCPIDIILPLKIVSPSLPAILIEHENVVELQQINNPFSYWQFEIEEKYWRDEVLVKSYSYFGTESIVQYLQRKKELKIPNNSPFSSCTEKLFSSHDSQIILVLPDESLNSLQPIPPMHRRVFTFTRRANTDYPLLICGNFTANICIPMLKKKEFEYSISIVAFSPLLYDVYFYSFGVVEEYKAIEMNLIPKYKQLTIPARIINEIPGNQEKNYHEAIKHNSSKWQ